LASIPTISSRGDSRWKPQPPREAAIEGITQCYDDGNGGAELEDMFVLDVVEGHVTGILGNDVVVNLESLKNKNCPWLH
jgi:hypothetical protein